MKLDDYAQRWLEADLVARVAKAAADRDQEVAIASSARWRDAIAVRDTIKAEAIVAANAIGEPVPESEAIQPEAKSEPVPRVAFDIEPEPEPEPEFEFEAPEAHEVPSEPMPAQVDPRLEPSSYLSPDLSSPPAQSQKGWTSFVSKYLNPEKA